MLATGADVKITLTETPRVAAGKSYKGGRGRKYEDREGGESRQYTSFPSPIKHKLPIGDCCKVTYKHSGPKQRRLWTASFQLTSGLCPVIDSMRASTKQGVVAYN